VTFEYNTFSSARVDVLEKKGLSYAEALIEPIWFEKCMALGVYCVILFRIGDVEFIG